MIQTAYRDASLLVIQGDVIESLSKLRAESVQTCVTSPPYWGLRDYGTPGQLGLERTPDEYVRNMINVFREVRRVLRKDGTLWLNLGDSYRERSLIGIPWLTALALKEDSWFLRNEIIWHKPNAMPDGVKDRLTRDHEQLFLFAKTSHHYYEADSIREPQKWDGASGSRNYRPKETLTERVKAGQTNKPNPLGRNRRTVWSVPTQPYKGSHVAVFPPSLIEPMHSGRSAGRRDGSRPVRRVRDDAHGCETAPSARNRYRTKSGLRTVDLGTLRSFRAPRYITKRDKRITEET